MSGKKEKTTDEPLIFEEKTDDEPLIYEKKTDDGPPPLDVPVVHDTKIGITITQETHLIDYTIKQIMILPQTSATVTVYINTDKGQLEKVLYMGTVDYLQWADDVFLYGWILKNIKNAF